MRKVGKTINIIMLIFCAIMSMAALGLEAPVEGELMDKIGYQIGLTVFFAIVALGFLLKVIGLRGKIKLIKKSKIIDEIVYWIIIVVIASLTMAITQNTLCSKEYLQRVQEADEAQRIEAQKKKAEEEKLKEEQEQQKLQEEQDKLKEEQEKLKEEQKKAEKEEKPIKEEEKEETSKVAKDSIYSKLSDENFGILTELLAKSFYSFSLDEQDFQRLEAAEDVKNCLQTIFDYANKNAFQLDPQYQEVFATKYEVVSKISNYDLLQERFIIEYYRDSAKKEWVYSINSYTVNEEDIVEYDGIKYIDPEGYLQPGVRVYWIEDDKMCEIGEVKEIAYNKEIEGTSYPYALYVEFFDDPYSTGWRSGYHFLRANKELSGKPAYYIQLLDKNRGVCKEEIDYKGNVSWKPLSSVSASKLVGLEVYMGTTNTKSYMFTIVSLNKADDIMMVEYPSGSVQKKSYDAIINNKALFIK